MSLTADTATNNINNATNNTKTSIDLREFCTVTVPYFTPLGGGQPDAAVVACVAVWEEEEKEAEKDVILPPDVLDTTLAMLCAPLTVTHVGDLRGRKRHFRCPAASVMLHTIDEDVIKGLKRITVDMPVEGGLSVTVVLEDSVTELPDYFMVGWDKLGRVDLRRTLLRRIGDGFLACCKSLTALTLPPSLTEVGDGFLGDCCRLQCVDVHHTALHTVGGFFASYCHCLTTVVLPDTVTEVGIGFLKGCTRVKVTSGSPALSELLSKAATKHNDNVSRTQRKDS